MVDQKRDNDMVVIDQMLSLLFAPGSTEADLTVVVPAAMAAQRTNSHRTAAAAALCAV